VLTELLLLVSIRSLLPIEKAGWPAPFILLLSAAAAVLTLALPMIPRTAAFFEFARPTPAHLALIVSIAVLYLVVTELVKRPLARFLSRQHHP
jgi:Mg2+-importing ATPase